jgi:hypothetical protein
MKLNDDETYRYIIPIEPIVDIIFSLDESFKSLRFKWVENNGDFFDENIQLMFEKAIQIQFYLNFDNQIMCNWLFQFYVLKNGLAGGIISRDRFCGLLNDDNVSIMKLRNRQDEFLSDVCKKRLMYRSYRNKKRDDNNNSLIVETKNDQLITPKVKTHIRVLSDLTLFSNRSSKLDSGEGTLNSPPRSNNKTTTMKSPRLSFFTSKKKVAESLL